MVKPLEIIHRLDQDDRDYEKMKTALLAAYGLSAEKLKERFFSASMCNNETASQFASRLGAYLRDWQAKDGAEDTVEGIKDLFLRAQFVKSCPQELVARLKVDKVGNLKEMSEMAEAYFEAYDGKKGKPKPHTEGKSDLASKEPPAEVTARERVPQPPPRPSFGYKDRPNNNFRRNYSDRSTRGKWYGPRYEGRHNATWQRNAAAYHGQEGPREQISESPGSQTVGSVNQGGSGARKYGREEGSHAL